MYQLNDFEFPAFEIAGLAGGELQGDDILVDSVCSLNAVNTNAMTLCYPSNKEFLKDICVPSAVFCTKDTVFSGNDFLSFIVVENPKFAFFSFINDFLIRDTDYWVDSVISESSAKYPDVEFGFNVRVGQNVLIAPGTKIGSNSIVGSNVVIRTNVTIGSDCVIKDNTVIGSEGFGYTKHEGRMIHVPQIGFIVVGDDVVIGSNCTVERPALGETRLERGVKIDDLVQVGHNWKIGEGTIVTTGFKAVGGCTIGKNCFIGIGAVFAKRITVGDDCIIGAGAILTKSLESGITVYSKQSQVTKSSSVLIKNMLGTPEKNNDSKGKA